MGRKVSYNEERIGRGEERRRDGALRLGSFCLVGGLGLFPSVPVVLGLACVARKNLAHISSSSICLLVFVAFPLCFVFFCQFRWILVGFD